MIQWMDESSGKIIGFLASEKLTDEDYANVFVPRLEEAIEEYGTVCLLMQLEHFEGWTAGAAWEDLKMWPQLRQIERIAIVGDHSWEGAVTRISDILGAFSETELRYFNEEDITEAWDWLREGAWQRVEEACRAG
jgi:hypothetical protein